MRARTLPVLSALTALAAFGVTAQWDPSAIETQEVCRIRIGNKPGGLVQVSTDTGRTYWTVGRVKAAANARIPGFAAASYTPRGTVAATAVHGIRIKTGQAAIGIGKAQQPLMFSITPAEFSVIPRRYGGHVPRSAQIVTDIHAGRSIFRNQSPYVGNPVFIEQSGELLPLPEDYAPAGGETFVIIVRRPSVTPKEIVFENRAGGAVTAVWPDGRSEELTRVARPVTGVGRYDGTTFTGTGAINTNHAGVLTIGTAPICPPGTREGGQAETRGGFMIQPSYHVKEQRETAPQVMVVGPAAPGRPVLEGKPPIFGGFINLSSFSRTPPASYRAEVRIDDGEWEVPPAFVGKLDSAFTARGLQDYFRSIGRPREVRAGVTALRIVFPDYSPAEFCKELARESLDYTRSVEKRFTSLSGTVVLQPSRPSKKGDTVLYWIDGVMSKASNRPPFSFEWDTSRYPNGLHEVVVESRSSAGQAGAETRVLLVRN